MKAFLLTAALIVLSNQLQGQDIEIFIEGGAEDGEKLLKNYFEPAFLGLGYGLTNGWANTAKSHQPLGFDLTLSASVAFVPERAEFFTFNASDYDNVTLSDPSKNQLPTIMGANVDADQMPELIFNEGTDEEVRISSPTGVGMEEAIGYNALPTPMVQAGIGLIKETDLKLRMIPTLTFQRDNVEVRVGMLGFGILHDIKQYVPAFVFSPFELSVLVGFSRIAVQATPNTQVPDNYTRQNFQGGTLQFIASKEIIKAITLYGSVGLNGTFTRVKLNGSYEIESGIQPLIDPIDFRFANFSPRATAGIRFNLAAFTIHADYTLQKFQTVSTGLGFSIR